MSHFNFITEFLRVTERFETPTSFIKWSAITAISATLRDSVYFSVDYRALKIYPNIYVLILGESALLRKGAPFQVLHKILKGDPDRNPGVNNTKVIGGRATMQGILKTLANSESDGPKGGSAILIAQELDAFFIKDDATIGLLTDLYDYHEYYDGHLVSYDVPPIRDLCLTLIGGTNEPMMRKMITNVALEGGLIGRSFVIEEQERRHKDSGFRRDVKYSGTEDYKILIDYLKALAKFNGPVTLADDAIEYFNIWYDKIDFARLYSKTGYEGRLHTHALKVATCLAAANSNFDMKISLSTLREAIDLCSELLPQYKQMGLGSGISPTLQFSQKVVKVLLKAHSRYIGRGQLLSELHADVTGKQLDEIMGDFVQKGWVKEEWTSTSRGWKIEEKFFNTFNPRNNHQARSTTN